MSSDHVCESVGCKSTLVLDGNMKNTCQVCMLKDVAQLHFPRMPGALAVGKLIMCLLENETIPFH